MKMLMILCLAVMPVFFSCIMFDDTENVAFSLPYSSVWTVRTCRDGREETFIVSGDSFELDVEKEFAFPCLALDMVSGKAVGAVYPFFTGFNFSAAFPAEVMISLLLTSCESPEATRYFLSTFNWVRFCEECAALGDDVALLDKDYIVKKIASGKFSKRDLKKMKSSA